MRTSSDIEGNVATLQECASGGELPSGGSRNVCRALDGPGDDKTDPRQSRTRIGAATDASSRARREARCVHQEGHRVIPTTVEAEVARLLERGAEAGSLQPSEVEGILDEVGLDDEEVEALYEEIDELGIELRDDRGRERRAGPSYANGELAAATTDSLQLFLNEMARYPLLAAKEDVELAKRIERGDLEAKHQAQLTCLHELASVPDVTHLLLRPD